MVDRLTRKGFWRVEAERWGDDQDDEGYIVGTETFLGGSSTPYASPKEAEAAALVALRRGDWVKIVHYPSQFERVSE